MDWFLLLEYLLYWLIFGCIHTILTIKPGKSYLPLESASYRLFYNVVATVTFLIVLSVVPYIFPVLIELLVPSSLIDYLALVVIGIGMVVLVLGLSAWDLKGFLGLKEEGGDFNTDGVYRWSRHPVYTGILMILVGLLIVDVSITTLSWFLGAGGYFILGTIPEEYKLNRQFDNYSVYSERVGRFFPYLPKYIRIL